MNLIVSPHMDDAALCLGGTLAEGLLGTDNHILCVFNSVWTCTPELMDGRNIDSLNKAEHEQVMSALGCSYEYWDYPEANARGYSEWYSPLDLLRDRALFDILYNRLSTLLYESSYENIFFPMSVERHTDHELLYRVLRRLLLEKGRPESCRIFLYEDLPYSYYVNMAQWIADMVHDYALIPFLMDIRSRAAFKIHLLTVYKTQVEQRDIDATMNYAESIVPGRIIERFWEIKTIHTGEFYG